MGKPLILLALALLLSMFLIVSIINLTTSAVVDAARSFPNAAGETRGKTHAAASSGSSPADDSEWIDDVMMMGQEKCEEEEDEEECVKRRMVSEAHLDYIYTQKEPHH